MAKNTATKPSQAKTFQHVDSVIALLKRRANKATREGMARYGLPSDRAFGVPVGTMKKLAKDIGRNHGLAGALWDSGWYEARMMAGFIDDPAQVTPAQMERWTAEFDNWGICDTVCFNLFDRTPHAWSKVSEWADREEEFVKRTAFALLASLVAHDKEASDQQFLRGLQLIEKAATDERNFVKKGVNWSLRCIGKRNAALNEAGVAVSQRLAASTNANARWVGKDALRELMSPKLKSRFAKKKKEVSPRTSRSPP
jgi:3-methyladenine DNA glycosylase AlkD